MEALLLASGVFLAYRHQKLPQLSLAPFFVQSTDESVDASAGGTAAAAAAVVCQEGSTEYECLSDADKKAWDEAKAEEKRALQKMQGEKCFVNGVEENCPLGPPSRYYPEDKYYNRIPRQEPLPSHPSTRPARPVGVPPRGVQNPVELEMMQDIRTGQHRVGGSGAPFRPSWVRHTVDDVPQGRQERDRDWSVETPRNPKDMQNFHSTYEDKTLLTLNGFGKGGLPFDDQIRVRPDGLDPVASRRTATARYNQYALGEDLTQSTRDDGRIRGVAAGQGSRGIADISAGAWEVMPNRGIQLQPVSGQGGSSAIRSSGRGAPLAAFAGKLGKPMSSSEETAEVRDGFEWDIGRTGNKSLVDAAPLRSERDFYDKHEDVDALETGIGAGYNDAMTSTYQTFRGTTDATPRVPDVDTSRTAQNLGPRENLMQGSASRGTTDATPRVPDVDTSRTAQNLGPRENLMQGSASKAADSTSWRFSFDLKKLFDMAPATPTRPETVPAKKVLVDAKDEKAKHATVAAKRRTTDMEPHAKNVGAFGASVHKTETSTDQKKIATSTIRSSKKVSTEQGAPLGSNSSGKSNFIKKSNLLAKWNALDDGILYNNDHIFDRGGILSEPLRAPKGTMPDYTQEKISTTRNPGEFRRR